MVGAIFLLIVGWFPLSQSLVSGAALASAAAPSGYSSVLTRYPYLTSVTGAYATVNFATDQSQNTAVVMYGEVGVDPTCTAHSVAATSTPYTVYPSPYYSGATNGINEYQWKATLTVVPGKQYCYRVYLGTAPQLDLLGSNPAPHFTVPAASSTAPFTFAVLGDMGYVDMNGLNPDQAAILSQLKASKGVSFALQVGDTAFTTQGVASSSPTSTATPTPGPTPATTPVNPPLQTQYGDLGQVGYSTSAFFGPLFWAGVGATLPFYPATGTRGFSSPFLVNFPQVGAVTLSAGRFTVDSYPSVNGSLVASYPSAWYAFDFNNVRFYILEATWNLSNVGTGTIYTDDYAAHWTPTSPEYQWLAADLATHPNEMKFAVFHLPLYSDSVGGPSDTNLQGVSSLEGLLSQNGVVMAFNGDAHIYERNNKPNANSLVSYVIGAGGAPLDPIGTGSTPCSTVDAYGIGWASTKSLGDACGTAPVPTSMQQVYSFLLVSVNGDQVTVTPTNELGQTFDVQSYNFAPVPPAPTPTVVPSPTPTSVPIPVTGGRDIFLPEVMR
ncbi:MAG: hypothetical protein M1281_10630 [Chloroflexi bacterium]|nr:hypothetical protein [Chloroflexota bacterium]